MGGGEGSERNVERKVTVAKSIKSFIDKNNRLCGHQNSSKL